MLFSWCCAAWRLNEMSRIGVGFDQKTPESRLLQRAPCSIQNRNDFVMALFSSSYWSGLPDVNPIIMWCGVTASPWAPLCLEDFRGFSFPFFSSISTFVLSISFSNNPSPLEYRWAGIDLGFFFRFLKPALCGCFEMTLCPVLPSILWFVPWLFVGRVTLTRGHRGKVFFIFMWIWLYFSSSNIDLWSNPVNFLSGGRDNWIGQACDGRGQCRSLA